MFGRGSDQKMLEVSFIAFYGFDQTFLSICPATVLSVTLHLHALVLLHSPPLTHSASWQGKGEGGQKSCTLFPVWVLGKDRERTSV